MKHLFLLIITLFILELSAQTDFTKNLNKISFEELGITKDSIAIKQFNLPKAEQPNGTNQKELNKIQLDNFQKTIPLNLLKNDSINNIANNILPKVDSSKSKKDSIIISDKTKTKQTSQIQENTTLESTISKEKTIIKVIKTDTIKTIIIKNKSTEILTKKDTISIKTTPSPIVSDFSTNPVVKTTKELADTKEIITEKNNYLDSLKNKPLKDFYIETKPLINKNGKIITTTSPPQAEIQKPTEQKNIYTEIELAEQKKKDKYNQYLREADSIRYTNKKTLDSLLATLNIKIPIEVHPKDYIEIYVSGGGLVGNKNSKTYDRTIFYPSGLMQREYYSQLSGVEKYEKKIQKEDLTTLAQFIVDLGFFDLAENYECPKDDETCKYRMKQDPMPIALTITIAIGIKRHTVNIDFYAPRAEKNWVNYPKNIEKILDAIYSMSEK